MGSSTCTLGLADGKSRGDASYVSWGVGGEIFSFLVLSRLWDVTGDRRVVDGSSNEARLEDLGDGAVGAWVNGVLVLIDLAGANRVVDWLLQLFVLGRFFRRDLGAAVFY